jgi:peroxiredoxin
MRSLPFFLKLAVVTGTLALTSHGALGSQRQSGAPESLPDVAKIGPQVGTAVPDFSLPDQNGRLRTIASLMGPKGLVLVFSRSADWCPYCKTQLVEIQARLNDTRQNGLGLAVITYDPVPVLADFATRRGISFPLLSDQGSAIIKRYGILNTTVDPSNAQFGYPFPGTFILDRRGIVTSRFFEPAYQERNTISSVLVRLGNKVNVPATKVSSPNLDITSYASDRVVAPGTHFSVVLDVTPGPRVHVYAPEVRGYKPIAFAIEHQPGLVIRDAQYPKSEDYFFAPLKEHVPVYQSPFRIVQDLMIDPSPAGQSALTGSLRLTIKGVLNYQACDDKVCFSPQTLPLSWTVDLKALDRERAAQP